MMIELHGVLFLLSLALGAVYLGCRLGVVRKSSTLEGDQFLEVSWFQALSFPVVGSCMLILLYFYFNIFQYVMLFGVITGSGVALQECLYFLFANSWIAAFSKSTSEDTMNARSTRISVISALLCCLVLYDWFTNANFIAHDILGVALCVQFISVLRFPNLKVATVCFGALFFYDMFWVFYSEKISVFEGKNVMVEVATKEASNPVREVGAALHIDFLQTLGTRHINLPIKLLYPVYQWVKGHREMGYMMLGLGDIALPGILLSMAYQFDLCGPPSGSQRGKLTADDRLVAMEEDKKEDKKEDKESVMKVSSYRMQSTPIPTRNTNIFPLAFIGYVCGLIMAFSSGYIFQHAQPALIFIVPGILIPLVSRAYYCGVLNELWNGVKLNDE